MTDVERDIKKQYYKENMLKLYLEAIEKGETSSMMNLAYFYESEENYPEMIQYYEMVISIGNESSDYYDALDDLAEYYEQNEDYDNCLKYIKMMKGDNTDQIKSIIKRIKYDELEDICEKYNLNVKDFIQDKIQYMKNKQKFKKEDDCLICLEHKDLIPFDCLGHYFCEKCYYKMDKCPVCNIEKHQLML